MSVTIVVKDLRKNEKETTFESVASSTKIGEFKQQIATKITDLPPEKMLLYLGPTLMLDGFCVGYYNKSKRSKIGLDLRAREDCTINVRTLQSCNMGGCVFVPMWAFCCRQTVPIQMPTHMTIFNLKEKIVDELSDERFEVGKLKLSYGRKSLDEDDCLLRDANISDGSTLTLIVPCCFFKNSKNRNEKNEKAASPPVSQPVSQPASQPVSQPASQAISRQISD